MSYPRYQAKDGSGIASSATHATLLFSLSSTLTTSPEDIRTEAGFWAMFKRDWPLADLTWGLKNNLKLENHTQQGPLPTYCSCSSTCKISGEGNSTLIINYLSIFGDSDIASPHSVVLGFHFSDTKSAIILTRREVLQSPGLCFQPACNAEHTYLVMMVIYRGILDCNS